METVTRIDSLSKRYSDGWRGKGSLALDDLSLEIAAGQLVGVCGGNGSGKSTLLKILCGLLPDYEGRVEIGGLEPKKAVSLGLIGYVPERPSFPAHQTPRSLLTVLCQLSGISLEARGDRVKAVLGRVDLTSQADKRISVLSKGAVQRLSIAQALVHDPQIVLADEPMDGLDPLARQKTEEALCSLVDEGKTVIVATHLLDGLEPLCHQVLVLHEGRALFQGTPDFETGLKGWLLDRLAKEAKTHA